MKKRIKWTKMAASLAGVLICLMAAGIIFTLNGKINNLSAQLSEVENSVYGTDYLSGWYGKTWCSYGDSITQEAQWQDYITDYFGFSTHYERGLGSCTFVNNGQTWYANEDGSYNSRYGFAGVTQMPEGTTEHEGWMCSWDRITTMIPQDVDLVVVMGGTNDAGQSAGSPMGDLSYPFDDTTYMGAVALTLVRIQEWVPNATVVLCSPPSGRGINEDWMESDEDMNQNQTEPVYNSLGYTTQDYAEASRQVAEYLSIPYIDVFGNTGINQFNRSEYIRDLVHPTEAGGEAIARVIIGGLKLIEPLN